MTETAPSPDAWNRLDFHHPQPTLLLSVVIVNYNLGRLVQRCVDSIKATGIGDCEIILVDNDSRPGDLDPIRARHADVIVLEQKANLGFGSANNIGFEHARGRYIVALNPDALVPPGLLERTLALFEGRSNLGTVGAPQKVNADLYVSSAQEELRPLTFFRRILPFTAPKRAMYRGSHAGGALAENTYCSSVTGCYMAFERDSLARVGGFDRRIFMYGEEVELCARLRRHGLEVIQLGDTFVDHDHGASTKGLSLWRDVQMQTGQLICVGLTHGPSAARISAAAISLGHLLRLPAELAARLGGNRDKLASRLARLKRSLAAIGSPPERSGPTI